ncbi:hypothetical protein ZWY2020_037948 [Hordeum vulgare]|nr:hypothetical protein ZWY2020_037948 [Hordeum vulgare]
MVVLGFLCVDTQITSGEELLCHHGRSRKKIYHAVSIPGPLTRAAASLRSLPPPSPIAVDASSLLARCPQQMCLSQRGLMKRVRTLVLFVQDWCYLSLRDVYKIDLL